MSGPCARPPTRRRGLSGSATPRRSAAWLVGLLGLAVLAPSTVAAQPLVGRTPNLAGPWVPSAGNAHFSFLHRFELVGEESKKLVNYPTLRLGLGLPAGLAAEATYTSNSELRLGTSNEWELGLRKAFRLGERIDVAGALAWNTAAESVDAEVTGRARWGAFSVLGVVRGFGEAYGAEAAAALGGGLEWRPTPRLSVVGDLVRVVTTDTLPTAWSAGVHLAIPSTPHTLGFVVSNVGVTTLQGASRGLEDADGETEVRYGFAFTLPLGTASQWARIFHGGEDAPGGADVEIRDFAFGPDEIVVEVGESVAWINEDEVVHTVTSDDEGAFDSGPIQPGEGYSRRFDEPGEYPYHCTPHPFMKGVVRVEAASD